MTVDLRKTPLHSRHACEGARLVPFAGFEMPVSYGSIIREHQAVRRSAGLFDVSHMGEIRLRGPQAPALAQRLFTNDVAGMEPGRVRYGLLCQEDGGVIDDVTLYRYAVDDLLFCVNASNIESDLAWLRRVHRESGLDCQLIDESEETALMAIQGPRALEQVHGLLPKETRPPRRWRFQASRIAGVPVQLSRTGYTGEDGYEIFCPAAGAGDVWEALRSAGGEALTLAGLGARDTLRTEMAYPLYGHELERTRTPVEAGLTRFLAMGKGFIGESALAKLQESDDTGPRLIGLILEGRQVARSGYPILADTEIGSVSSGTYGPSVGRSIALGYVPARYSSPGTRLAVEIRGRRVACEVTSTPFFDRQG